MKLRWKWTFADGRKTKWHDVIEPDIQDVAAKILMKADPGWLELTPVKVSVTYADGSKTEWRRQK